MNVYLVKRFPWNTWPLNALPCKLKPLCSFLNILTSISDTEGRSYQSDTDEDDSNYEKNRIKTRNSESEEEEKEIILAAGGGVFRGNRRERSTAATINFRISSFSIAFASATIGIFLSYALFWKAMCIIHPTRYKAEMESEWYYPSAHVRYTK